MEESKCIFRTNNRSKPFQYEKKPKAKKENFQNFSENQQKTQETIYNICKDIEDGNRNGKKTRKVFQKFSGL